MNVTRQLYLPAARFLLSFLIVLLFIPTTSPLYDTVVRYDMAAYYIIGSGWLEHGMLPYLDLFDNKSPLLYLIYGLASTISHMFPDGSSWAVRGGLLIVEAVNVCVCITLVGRLCDALGVRRLPMQALFVCGYRILGQGMLTEALSMPFILWTMCLFADQRHTQRFRFVAYGMCCAATMLLRLNNALLIGIVIVMECVGRKGWRELPFCIASYLMSVVPFAAYFIYKGAWNDMIFCLLESNWMMVASGMTLHLHYFLLLLPLLPFAAARVRQQWVITLSAIALSCIVAAYPLVRTADTAEADMLNELDAIIPDEERDSIYYLNAPNMTFISIHFHRMPANKYFGSYTNEATTLSHITSDMKRLRPLWVITESQDYISAGLDCDYKACMRYSRMTLLRRVDTK